MKAIILCLFSLIVSISCQNARNLLFNQLPAASGAATLSNNDQASFNPLEDAANPVSEPSPYAFEYDSALGSRKESSDGNTVRGTYTLVGADGVQRIVNYIADKDGFRASIATNEPGTEAQSPADISLQSSQPKAEDIAREYGPLYAVKNQETVSSVGYHDEFKAQKQVKYTVPVATSQAYPVRSSSAAVHTASVSSVSAFPSRSAVPYGTPLANPVAAHTTVQRYPLKSSLLYGAPVSSSVATHTTAQRYPLKSAATYGVSSLPVVTPVAVSHYPVPSYPVKSPLPAPGPLPAASPSPVTTPAPVTPLPVVNMILRPAYAKGRTFYAPSASAVPVVNRQASSYPVPVPVPVSQEADLPLEQEQYLQKKDDSFNDNVQQVDEAPVKADLYEQLRSPIPADALKKPRPVVGRF